MKMKIRVLVMKVMMSQLKRIMHSLTKNGMGKNKKINSLLKDITKVISRGRDRLVEIGSNRLLSHEE